MNATEHHPLVTAYLESVARETAELPAERRAELLADLREHIQVSGAEDDEQLRAVLAELGEPRTVAASALAEEAPAGRTGAATPGTGRTRTTAILLGVSGVLLLLNPYAGAIALIVALVMLWGAPQWDNRRKVIGTATGVAVPVVVFLGALLGDASRIGPMEVLLILVFSLGVPLLGMTLLLRAVRR
ncbi:HAAS signaling domain-containing protein [Streptomyces sp. NPDC017254]|uniref:HAAS signaling domain-containing protein n=1 Tax=unclassified Streptomyces TaxID=2593676 RepID=UPI003793CC9C